MNIDEIVGAFLKTPNAVALGPSSLESFADRELLLNEHQKIAVPENLMRLLSRIRQGESEYRIFLIRVIRYFRALPRRAIYDEYQDSQIVDRLITIISEFESLGRLLVIGEEMDGEIQESLAGLYPGPAFEIALSPKRNFLRDYLTRIYSWSKHTGGVIVERTRRVFSDLGHHIATLQLPDKLDHYVGLKSRYVDRVFGFRGGKAAKVFVGCAVSVAGFGSPAMGIAGVVITFADP